MTPSLRLLMNERDQAWYRGKLTKIYRLREEVSCAIRKSKRRLMSKVSCSNDAKSLWKCIKKIGRYRSSKTAQSSRSKTLQQFNDFFSSV